MIPEVNRQFWKKLDKDLKDNLHRRLLNEAGDRALRFSKERFRQKNWVDTTPQKWKPRQRRDSGSLLVRSVRLKRSIRVLSKTATSVTIGTDVPYARIHNEGGTIREKVFVKQHSR
ncbi:phage virion morphogenesis protein, partial [Ornithobacterium rhinotracheale]